MREGMMNAIKSVSVEELQVIGRFESLRSILLSEQYRDHLSRPLAYWALPTDRRLPLAFMGRTLEDLLRTPFAELSNTPGIGKKKISSFLNLLARAANTTPSELPTVTAHEIQGEQNLHGKVDEDQGRVDLSAVSEVVWGQWRASVVRHGLGTEKLGRFAPSLSNMTRVIWDMPLETYTGATLSEIRAMKTHGEKRVHAILEVFRSVHLMVANMGVQDHLVVRIVPRLIDRVERWIGVALQTPGIPSREEMFENFISPLLEQVRADATQQIAKLAESRLGLTGTTTSVRQVARSMGLTRARVYQLLNEINDIMTVRWPTGRHQVYEFREKLLREARRMSSTPDLDQFLAAVELFYPDSRRGAAGPLEQSTIVEEEGLEQEAAIEDGHLVGA